MGDYVDAKLENGAEPAAADSTFFTILAAVVIVSITAGTLGILFYPSSNSGQSIDFGRTCFCALDPFNQSLPGWDDINSNCLPFTNFTGELTRLSNTPLVTFSELFSAAVLCLDNSTTGEIASAGFSCVIDCVNPAQ